MKQLLMFLIVCLMAVRCMAEYVIWYHSFSKDAVVHDASGTYSIKSYAENVLGDSLFNVAYRVKNATSGTYLNFPESAFWDVEVYDVNWIETVDGDLITIQWVSLGEVEVDHGAVTDWNTFTGNWNDEIIVELLQYDEKTDSFSKFAYSDVFLLSDEKRDGHTWVQQTIAPSNLDHWLSDFYTDTYVPVPEPSVEILIALGLAALLVRRKTV